MMSNKNLLQKHFQKSKLDMPLYQSETRGQDHKKEFRANINLGNDNIVYSGWFLTKKKSEEDCATQALISIDRNDRTQRGQQYSQQKQQKEQQQQPQNETELVDNMDYLEINKNSVNGANNNNNKREEDKETILKLHEEINALKRQVIVLSSANSSAPINCNNLLFDKENIIKPIIKNITDEKELSTLPVMNKNTPRDYQIELYKEAMKDDIICCLPTGLGKTLISCMVIKKMKELNPNKFILFVVDRIPLVVQQSFVIEEETGLKVLYAHGDSFKQHQLYQTNFDVLVIIGSLLIKLLDNRELKLTLSSFSLIVIDEAHHIVKDHPFAVLLRDRLTNVNNNNNNSSTVPKLLGLTASPTGKKDFLTTLLSLKLITKISKTKIIKPPKDEIEKYLKSEYSEIIPIKTNNLEYYSIKLLQELIKMFKPNFNTDNSLCEIFSTLIDLNGNIVGGSVGNSVVAMDTTTTTASSPSNNNASPNNNNETVSNFLLSFFEKVNDYINFSIISGQTQDICGLNLKQFIVGEINTIPDKIIRQRILSITSFIPDNEEIARNSSKLEVALQILEQCFKEDGNSLKSIIFVKTKKTAKTLYDILERIKKDSRFSFLKPQLVVGHGTSGVNNSTSSVDGGGTSVTGNSSVNGMSISAQKKAIEAFKEGICNVMIATSVLEEGFDSVCNTVIRLDPPTTVTANIQSRGRLRNKDSKFFGIVKVDDPNETTIYDTFIKQEKHLEDAIEFLKTGVLPWNTIGSNSTNGNHNIVDLFTLEYGNNFDINEEGNVFNGIGGNSLLRTNSIAKVEEIVVKIRSSIQSDLKVDWNCYEHLDEYNNKCFKATAIFKTMNGETILIHPENFEKASLITGNSKKQAKENTAKSIVDNHLLYHLIRNLKC